LNLARYLHKVSVTLDLTSDLQAYPLRVSRHSYNTKFRSRDGSSRRFT